MIFKAYPNNDEALTRSLNMDSVLIAAKLYYRAPQTLPFTSMYVDSSRNVLEHHNITYIDLSIHICIDSSRAEL